MFGVASEGAYINEKTVEQLLIDMYGTAEPGSTVHEQQKMAIFARSIADLASAIRDDAAASDRVQQTSASLQRQLVILNWVLAIATAIGAIATAYLAFFS
jgi:hypothetical protein